MSLDGLRAWIGEVERKLGARTRVFLALAAIAIGGAGAGIYLGVEAQSDKVSADDMQALEARLQAQIDQLGASAAGETDPDVAELELKVKALQTQVEALDEDSPSATDGGTSAAEADDANAPGAGGKSGVTTEPPSAIPPALEDKKGGNGGEDESTGGN